MSRQENLGAQRSRLAVRAGEVGDQLARRNDEAAQFRGTLGEIESRLADLQRRFESTKAAAAVKDAAVRELAGRLSSLKERRSVLSGRRELLASLEQKLEGLADGPRAVMINVMARLFAVSPAKGADTPLWTATAPELNGVTGKSFANRKQQPPKFTDPGPIAELERLCGELEAATG